MIYKTTPRFWDHYNALPPPIRELANKSYELLKQDRKHPSLAFKKVQDYWSARVGPNYRALALEMEGGYLWVWIGPHDQYMRFIRGKKRR